MSYYYSSTPSPSSSQGVPPPPRETTRPAPPAAPGGTTSWTPTPPVMPAPPARLGAAAAAPAAGGGRSLMPPPPPPVPPGATTGYPPYTARPPPPPAYYEAPSAPAAMGYATPTAVPPAAPAWPNSESTTTAASTISASPYLANPPPPPARSWAAPQQQQPPSFTYPSSVRSSSVADPSGYYQQPPPPAATIATSATTTSWTPSSTAVSSTPVYDVHPSGGPSYSYADGGLTAVASYGSDSSLAPPSTPQQPTWEADSAWTGAPGSTLKARSATTVSRPPVAATSASSAGPNWTNPTFTARPATKDPPMVYQHNNTTSLLLIPAMWIVLTTHASDQEYSAGDNRNGGLAGTWLSSLPILTFMVLLLLLYGLDLANLRETLSYAVWWVVPVLTAVSGWTWLLQEEESEHSAADTDSDWWVLQIIFQTGLTAILWTAVACWISLQWPAWMQRDVRLAQSYQATLHAVTAPAAAAMMTLRLSQWIMAWTGMDAASLAAPYLWAGLLAASMWIHGGALSSWPALGPPGHAHHHVSSALQQQQQSAAGKDDDHKEGTPRVPAVFCISSLVAFGHLGLLLLTPPLMHVVMQAGRILSSKASMDDACDLVLVAVGLPTVISWFLFSRWSNPSRVHHPTPYHWTWRPSMAWLYYSMGSLAVLLAMGALQQRYLIPLSHQVAHRFFFAKQPPPIWLLSLYWTLGMASAGLAVALWAPASASTEGALPISILGEYHEDVVQLLLALSGLALGKAFGLPWNFTPLPILAFLGLSLWLTTRMLRYLVIFLFVLHATAMVIFSYRFAGIEYEISLAGMGNLSLTRFGLVVAAASVVVGLVTGLAVRSKGGFLSQLLHRFDVAGILLVSYTLLLTVLEITLLKRPVPRSELVGLELEADEITLEDMLYDPVLAWLTSAILVTVAVFLRRNGIVTARSAWAVASLAVGKAVAIYIDSSESLMRASREKIGDSANSVATSELDVLMTSLMGALVCIVLLAPRVLLRPIHVKSPSRSKGSMQSRAGIPGSATRVIFIYAFVFLPLTLLVAIPSVLFPLADVMAINLRGDTSAAAFYRSSSSEPPLFELIGSTLALWGLACLSMLNFYLPDGGGEAWKKMSALAFLMGVSVSVVAPTLGLSVAVGEASSSPYAALSSLGSQLLRRSKSRTGGWGLLSAGMATLLALTGPLELKERRTPAGRRDRYLLFRAMMFSLLFGGGLTWFVVVQSMSESDWLSLLISMLACLTVAFLGTIASVLGYFLELENFDEVQSIATTWLFAFPLFMPISGIPQFVRPSNASAFGNGGWLFTYLLVSCLSFYSFTLALSFRTLKDQRTRGIGNASCFASWLCAVVMIFGRFGVAGLDANNEVTTLLGLSASMVGTLAVCPLLFALEGEKSAKSGRTRRITVNTSSSTPQKASFIQLSLPHLTRSNGWVPALVCTVVVFQIATLYAVLLRGLLVGGIATSHAELYASVFGTVSHLTDNEGGASISKEDHDLMALVEKSLLHEAALATSAKLAGSNIWTSDSILGPLIHFLGLILTLPSVYLTLQRWWWCQAGSAFWASLTLPLTILPLVFCHGIPSLRAAGWICLAMSLYMSLSRRRTAQESNMQM